MNYKRILFTLTLTLTPILSAHAAQPTTTAKKSELNHLDKNIATIQSDLQQATIKKTHLQDALKNTEMTESQIDNQIKATQQHMAAQQQKLAALKQQSIPLINAKDQNHALLKAQIRAAYLFSQAPYLKIVLAPKDVMQTQRILMYFHYITQAQIHTIQQLQKSLAACTDNQAAIQDQYAQLLTLKQKQLHNQQQLQVIQAQRQQLIQRINQRIQTKHQRLVALLHNKQALENTLKLLREQVARQAREAQQKREARKAHHAQHAQKTPKKMIYNATAFTRARGQLPWPTQGAIRDQFGTQINDSELRWDGVIIAAPEGQPVRAVAAGDVIFSKWMAGYGLLLIVNNGDGYMTLYGRNETLTQKVGDHVRAGEIIGTVGKSGGFARSGLYFSIRKNGVAINPALWCR